MLKFYYAQCFQNKFCISQLILVELPGYVLYKEYNMLVLAYNIYPY